MLHVAYPSSLSLFVCCCCTHILRRCAALEIDNEAQQQQRQQQQWQPAVTTVATVPKATAAEAIATATCNLQLAMAMATVALFGAAMFDKGHGGQMNEWMNGQPGSWVTHWLTDWLTDWVDEWMSEWVNECGWIGIKAELNDRRTDSSQPLLQPGRSNQAHNKISGSPLPPLPRPPATRSSCCWKF